MAHLIRLTDYQTNQPVLYNLDTVVQIEEVRNSTIITTRWGRNTVIESLAYIEAAANGTEVEKVSPPF